MVFFRFVFNLGFFFGVLSLNIVIVLLFLYYKNMLNKYSYKYVVNLVMYIYSFVYDVRMI